ncbi:ABC transporter substrate-binding protein [Saliphagus infecundisoli]|uniref:ABC transporter substrate-binding protein n=1 Tax=Saliphagus infecundisoli TaxID=1849069 RepID=A0ABD5QAC5_9EURY|nr:ABC transporter substrate-binding protein [Saliphagus infecundisoli]
MSRDRDYHGISRRRAIKITSGAALGVSFAGCIGGGDDAQAGPAADGGNGESSNETDASGNETDGTGTNESEDPSDETSDSNGTEDNQTEQQDSPSSSDKTEIRFWAGLGGDKLELLQSMASDFNDQSNTAFVNVSSKGNYSETLNAAISAIRSGDPPAVVQVNGANAAVAADSGAFATVEDMLPDINWDEFIPAAVNTYSKDGKVQSMPFNASTPVMYYNVDKFEEAGVDPIYEPSYQDVVDMGNQLLDADIELEYACTWPNHSWFVEEWFAMQDQVLVDNSNGRDGPPTEIYLASQAGKDIFSWQNQLYQGGLYFNPGIEAWGAAKQSFLTEKSAMMIISSAGINEITEGAKEEAGFNVETSWLPAPNGERTGVFIGGGSLWTPENIDESMTEAATEFIQWMIEPEQQVEWHKGTGYFPVRTSAVETLRDEGWFEENPNYERAFTQLQEAEATEATAKPVVGPNSYMREQIEKAFVDLMDGGELEPVLTNRKENIEQEFDSYQDKV